MKITVDTNILLRAVLADDDAQQSLAIDALESADMVAISLQTLCEYAWVLDRHYKAPRVEIVASIRQVLDMRNVVVNRPAVEAGLNVLEAGGDFADGVIAYDGHWLGGETFVSFDRKAVKLLTDQGLAARLLQ